MTIAYRDVLTSSVSDWIGGITFFKPSTVIDGDLLIATIMFFASNSIASTPSGWTLSQSISKTSGIYNISLFTYYKIASSEPIKWIWKFANNSKSAATTIIFKGTPTFNVCGVSGSDVPSTNIISSSVTPQKPNEILTSIYATLDTNNTPSIPSPQIALGGSYAISPEIGAYAITYEILGNSTAPTGTRTATSANPQLWVASNSLITDLTLPTSTADSTFFSLGSDI